MDRITQADIDNYIYPIFALLKKQEYTPIGVELDRNERQKLLDFFYVYNKYGRVTDIKVYNYLDSIDEIDIEKVNSHFYNEADEEIRKIIQKCGADPKNIFSYDGNMHIDQRIVDSMVARKEAVIGDYLISSNREKPVDWNSDEMNFLKEAKPAKYAKAKEGVINFWVYPINENGEIGKMIYRHDDAIHFGSYIRYKNHNIGGGIIPLSYDPNDKYYKDRINSLGYGYINEMFHFLESFEDLLRNNLIKNKNTIK